ncbi:lon protease homolog 2, peroxisomal isoform X1 [Octopus sinensis]|uniref:Lon protease homolog n=1 Tax=Octopus sinensis TaxID=2607531 RepID=A0A6P7SF57_9MOLL|nr:lon protease homolog 2, peroxisomal isoform X1 [Octopus sinensis]
MASSITIPRRLPLLIADNVLLPGSSMRILVRSLQNMNMVKGRLMGRSSLRSTIIGVIPKEQNDDTDEDLSTLHSIGTAAVVVQVTGTNWPKPAYTLLVTGLCRLKVEELLQETPYPVATVTQLDQLPDKDLDDSFIMDKELKKMAENFREHAVELVGLLDISTPIMAKLKKMLDQLPSQHLPDVCAAIVKASYSEKMQVLDAVELSDRFKRALPLIVRQIEALRLLQKVKKEKFEIVIRKEMARPSHSKKIFRRVSEDFDDGQEIDTDEYADFEQKIKLAKMPKGAHKAAIKELKRFKNMMPNMPEHVMIRNYLELMVELPWSKSNKDTLDIVQARKALDIDHYGLEKVKNRVLEYLAVRQLKNSLKGPIMCFVGPPGVGKTSIGRSIAHILGREFHRIALGGISDQSEIRGHRRTYIGSMPGRIIHGLKLVGTNNPVFLFDEIDKMNKSIHGDPAAALLEVLDPEQNHTFTDHYLNVPFDLSQVLFICTANNLAPIPPALIDRMEIISIQGYTEEEKLHIAERHLMPKQLTLHGLSPELLHIPTDTIKLIISQYTREAGVRNLERTIAAVCRAVAVQVAETYSPSLPLKQEDDSKPTSTTDAEEENGKTTTADTTDDSSIGDNLETTVAELSPMAHPPDTPIVIDETALEDILGPPMYYNEMSERLSQPGVAVGLAWTENGGQIMFVEALSMAGEGQLTLTGQLGDVMKESATLALNWVRSHAKKLGLETFSVDRKNIDLHIHFPAGAVGKDGPSAGVTVVCVLVSLFSGHAVRSDTAMTGEITLRGLVLPVGGIKEKVLAAHRAGIRRIIMPKKNEKDLHEIPVNVKNQLSFILAQNVTDVLNAAFDDDFPKLTIPFLQVQSKL